MAILNDGTIEVFELPEPAKLKGATRIITVDHVPERIGMAKRLGADIVLDYAKGDPVQEIMKITAGAGVDVAIEALGTQQTFESCLRVLKPGSVLPSLDVYSGKLSMPAGSLRRAPRCN